ncbi:hypothetical protein TNCV_1991961 [Trichonephila clavipes]|nr:hypothetical protein TNCV_1991961 [Trichonephila clavipes]
MQFWAKKKSPGQLHTWKNDRKAGEGASRYQCSCRVRNQQKVSFHALGKRTKLQVQLLESLVVAARGRQLQGMTDISSSRQKEADGSQQASLLSNSLQQRFTVAKRLHKGGLFACRPERCHPLKVDHRRHRLQGCREHKNWTTDQ